MAENKIKLGTPTTTNPTLTYCEHFPNGIWDSCYQCGNKIATHEVSGVDRENKTITFSTIEQLSKPEENVSNQNLSNGDVMNEEELRKEFDSWLSMRDSMTLWDAWKAGVKYASEQDTIRCVLPTIKISRKELLKLYPKKRKWWQFWK